MVESVAVATVSESFFCPQADSINILSSAVIMKMCFPLMLTPHPNMLSLL